MGTYVVQVKSGSEARAALRMQRSVDADGTTCYVPRFVTMQKKNGSWIKVEKTLFPGYVFIDTNDIDGFRANFQSDSPHGQGVRLLCQENGDPLKVQDEEIAWIIALANNVTRTVDMSEGVIEGDQIRIVSGPLKGHEAMIRKIDRHKRMAWVEIHLLGRTKTVRLGLEVVSKR